MPTIDTGGELSWSTGIRRHEERLDEYLLEGLSSGERIAVDEAYWQARKEKLAARLQHARES